jgi:hypothetical protein
LILKNKILLRFFLFLKNDCNELSQINPVGQLIPAHSKGTFPIVFESQTVQTFQRFNQKMKRATYSIELNSNFFQFLTNFFHRSISYRINQFYTHHIIVLAEVRPPSLKLNRNHVILNQLAGLLAESCYRSNVTIINPYNTAVEFTWIPIYGEQGTAFSIRPASGISLYFVLCSSIIHLAIHYFI